MSARTATDLTDAELQDLAARSVGEVAAVRVENAAAELRGEGAEPYVLLRLFLEPPSGQRPTWSTDEMFAFRQEVRRRVNASGYRDVVVSYEGGAVEGEAEEAQPTQATSKGAPGRGPER